jgi:histone deacetylase 11
MNVKLVYHKRYNFPYYLMKVMSLGLRVLTLGVFRELHPFVGDRPRRIKNFLLASGRVKRKKFVTPQMNEALILSYLEPDYHEIVHLKRFVAGAVEVPLLAYFPYAFVRHCVIEPMLWASCGTIQTVALAMQEGVAINLGGGFHHASFYSGGGFCLYPDIAIAIREIRKQHPDLKVAVIDCDAHQGNGTERALWDDPQTIIADMFNETIYPLDTPAQKATSTPVRLQKHTQDSEYLNALETHVLPQVEDFNPQLIIYGAGTDIYEKDPLGGLRVSAQGILQRDKLVADFARSRKIPLAVVLSGGYHMDAARIVADSILQNFIGVGG